MSSLKHAHTYERSRHNMEIYRCTDPRCTHFTRRDLIVGKEVTCSKCNQLCIATQGQLRAGQKQIGVKSVTCLYCSKIKIKPEVLSLEKEEKLSNILDDIFKEVG